MTPQIITALAMLALALIVIGLMAWGWRNRTRRDGALTVPFGEFADTPDTVHAGGLYVATTAHDEPLNRLAVRGLAFRSRVSVAVDTPGIMLGGVASETVLIPADAITSVGRATVVIDRVVEPDGLVRISWRIAPDTIVDTYLRLQQTSPDTLIAAIERTANDITTGTDA